MSHLGALRGSCVRAAQHFELSKQASRSTTEKNGVVATASFRSRHGAAAVDLDDVYSWCGMTVLFLCSVGLSAENGVFAFLLS